MVKMKIGKTCISTHTIWYIRTFSLIIPFLENFSNSSPQTAASDVNLELLLLECYATIGVVSNSDHQLQVSGKAGRSRWLGRRPRTRPVVMNPVDHPMGGGEGKSSGGHPRSRNGIPAKGYRTRSKTKASNRYIVERKKK